MSDKKHPPTVEASSTQTADEPTSADRALSIREPDVDALPVATFAEDDFRKPEPDPPSVRFRRRAPAAIGVAALAAVASGIGLGLLGQVPGYVGVGLGGVVCAPVIIGTILSLWPTQAPRRGRIGSLGVAALSTAILSMMSAVFLGEGAICLLFGTPLLTALSVVTSTIANRVVVRRLQSLDDRFRAGLSVLLVLLVPCAAGAFDVQVFFRHPSTSTVTSSVHVPQDRARVWESLQHLDVALEDPPSTSVMSLLPVPTALRGDGARVGAVREVQFHNGTVVATVTRLEEMRAYDIDLRLENAGREFFDHWVQLHHSRFELVDAPDGGTTIIHTTTYDAKLYPRVLFEPVERALGGMIQQHLVDVYADKVLGRARAPEPIALLP